ncbi:MAG: YbdK family carboxylate-amine ligase [Gaiellaceae bacterium]
MRPVPPPNAEQLRATFDAVEPMTVGVEEELMVLDAETFDLAPEADAVLALVDGDSRFKGELPAAQLEIVTAPLRSVTAVGEALAAARRDLASAVDGRWRFGTAGVHPFAAAEGVLSEGDAYAETRARYGGVARRQLVFALQVHVAVGGADRTLAVYNALRSYLPEIGALAANAAWFGGRDSEFASVRPKIAEGLPRQGVPPFFEGWGDYAAALAWGVESAMFAPSVWWWELRPHIGFGTLEVRVPDAQTTVADSLGVVAFVHALVAWLAARHDAGERLPVHPRWKIEENRWAAGRDGLDGELADLDTGERLETRARLQGLLDEMREHASPEIEHARSLLQANGAVRQREAADALTATKAIAGHFLG